MKNIFIRCILISFSCSTFASDQDITGVWRNIDDKTGFRKGLIEISKDANNVYTGKVLQIDPRPGYTPKTICTGCPSPYTDQPILGMHVITNMKADPNKPSEFSGGTILDPVNAKIYKGRLSINSKGDRLTVRGFIGLSVIGRSQTWIRKKD